ncbi:uncharacterized protein BN816_00772 [Firmicutes bacterium CAG:95]|nr:uncharacterized protein BN816_00772 [Firmicutes bacterium CAG:95]
MKVDTKEVNPAFQGIIQNPGQKVFLDANFFIPPDRSEVAKVRAYSFTDFKECWLIPLLSEFTGLAIHESVYDELVADSVKEYADEQTSCIPSKLRIHYDSELSGLEEALRNTYINKIAVHSLYNPTRDNAKDRGEVRSLSFMAVKQFLYFAANDALPVRLIKDAAKLLTGLDDMQIVQMYELIYYLYKTGRYDNKALRILYKYQYYLTAGDKRINPEWGCFVEQMDLLYNGIL